MKKTAIRLLMHETCNRFCAKCCNQTDLHDLDNLEPLRIDHLLNHDEVVLTGGETMIDPLQVQYIVRTIRQINGNMRIYMYTAKTKPPANLIVCMEHLDGLTLTLHEPKDVENFKKFQLWLNFRPHFLDTKSLRLNYFPEEDVSVDGLDLKGWDVEAIEWLDDCPVPNNEILLRWAPPTKQEHKYRSRYNAINATTVDPLAGRHRESNEKRVRLQRL